MSGDSNHSNFCASKSHQDLSTSNIPIACCCQASSCHTLEGALLSAWHDTGVYAALEDGLAALEDDVRAACDLFRAAAKRLGSDFAADLADVCHSSTIQVVSYHPCRHKFADTA